MTLSLTRVSGNYNNRDGYIDNVQPGRDSVNDRDRYALRGQLLIEPSEDLTIRLIADTASITEDCCGAPFFFNLPANAARTTRSWGHAFARMISNKREIKFDRALETEQEQSGFSAQVDWESGNFTFTSLSAFRDFEETNDIDADFIDIELKRRLAKRRGPPGIHSRI